MEYYSPLRYPGGKGKTADFFMRLFEHNDIVGGTYVEPYVGGGSVALHLLFNNIVDRIVINDKDRSLYAFWYSILNHTDDFCRLIHDTCINIDNWCVQREIQKVKEDVDLITLGFSTFFLNRTNRSGIIKAGVIGGINQTGNYLIDARFNKHKLISRIERIAQLSNHIELHNLDAIELVQQQRDTLPGDSLFYFDPPYYVKGQGLYMNYYNDQDHRNIYDEINLIQNQHWVVTYDCVPFIKDIYNDYRVVEFYLNYHAANASKGKEYMIFSHLTDIPQHKLLNNI